MDRCHIEIENNQDVIKDIKEIEDTIHKSINKVFEGFEADRKLEVYVLLTDNEGIRVFNREHRSIDKPTDVLTFPLIELYDGQGDIFPEDINPENGYVIMGDIIISLEKALEQSKEYGHSFLREVAFLATHGAFHLMGYDHDEPDREEIMIKLQESVLSSLGLRR